MPPIRMVLTDICVMLFIIAGWAHGIAVDHLRYWQTTFGVGILLSVACPLMLGLMAAKVWEEFFKPEPRYAQRY